MGKEHYISLITKQLNSQLSKTELRELNNWLTASSGNSNVASDFKEVWNSVSSYKSSATFDVDEAYQNFLTKYDIHSTGVNTADQVSDGISITRLLFAALTLAALIFGGLQLTSKINNTVSTDALASRTINLTANSTAKLAPNTSMNFDREDFTINSIAGQVYLDLEDQEKNLSIGFEDASADVSGAVLNIQNYKADNKLVADVEKGSVAFNINNERVQLDAGKQLTLEKGSVEPIIKDSDQSAFAWKKGMLSFDNTPLEEVFTALEKFYGVNIKVMDDSKVAGHFTAINYKPSSLDDCLEMLVSSISMEIQRKDMTNIEVRNIQAK